MNRSVQSVRGWVQHDVAPGLDLEGRARDPVPHWTPPPFPQSNTIMNLMRVIADCAERHFLCCLSAEKTTELCSWLRGADLKLRLHNVFAGLISIILFYVFSVEIGRRAHGEPRRLLSPPFMHARPKG